MTNNQNFKSVEKLSQWINYLLIVQIIVAIYALYYDTGQLLLLNEASASNSIQQQSFIKEIEHNAESQRKIAVYYMADSTCKCNVLRFR